MRDIVSTSGTELDHIVYDSFGNIVTETNATNGDRFKFAGMEYDATTGQYYDRARDYASGIGRFTSQDPDGFAVGDANLYRYVQNEPTGLTDPSGKEPTQAQDLAMILQLVKTFALQVKNGLDAQQTKLKMDNDLFRALVMPTGEQQKLSDEQILAIKRAMARNQLLMNQIKQQQEQLQKDIEDLDKMINILMAPPPPPFPPPPSRWFV